MSTPPLADLTLTDEQVHDEALNRLQTYGPLEEIAGYRCTREMVLDVVLQALVTQATIESVCADLTGSVCGETVRQYLNEQITVADFAELERLSNQALVAHLPRRLWKRRLEIAFDFHDEPFYGQSPELLAYACRGPAKHGTTHFFRVVTAYVIWHGVRVTLALLFRITRHPSYSSSTVRVASYSGCLSASTSSASGSSCSSCSVTTSCTPSTSNGSTQQVSSSARPSHRLPPFTPRCRATVTSQPDCSSPG